VSIRSFSVTKGENIVARMVLMTILIAGILLSAVVGATQRGGTFSGDLKSPSSPVIAAPLVAVGAGAPDAQPAASREFAVLDGLLSGASPFKESARHMPSSRSRGLQR